MYVKRFGKAGPDTVRTIEEIAAAKQAKKQRRKAGKLTSPGGLSGHASNRSDRVRENQGGAGRGDK